MATHAVEHIRKILARKWILVAIVILLLAASILLIVTKCTNQGIATRVPTVPADWKTYKDSTTHFSVRHPAGIEITNVTANELAGSGITSPTVIEYIIKIPGNISLDHSYAFAESMATSDNMEISITLMKADNLDQAYQEYKTYEVPKGPLIKAQTTKPLYLVEHIYTKDSGLDGKLQNLELASCLSKTSCVEYIPRPNNDYRYLHLVISSQDGWRYGGSPINIDSKNLQIARQIVSTLQL